MEDKQIIIVWHHDEEILGVYYERLSEMKDLLLSWKAEWADPGPYDNCEGPVTLREFLAERQAQELNFSEVVVP